MLSDLVHVVVPDGSCCWWRMTAKARNGRLISGRRNGRFRRNHVIPMAGDKGLLSTLVGHQLFFSACPLPRHRLGGLEGPGWVQSGPQRDQPLCPLSTDSLEKVS